MAEDQVFCQKFRFPITNHPDCKCEGCVCMHCAEQYCDRTDPESSCLGKRGSEFARFNTERCKIAADLYNMTR
jgi:hypothetical protein